MDMDKETGEGGAGAARPSDSIIVPQFSDDTTAAPAALETTGGEPPAAVAGPSVLSAAATAPIRKRTPGRWRRIPRPQRTTEHLWSPRPHSPAVQAMIDEADLSMLKHIESIENMREEDCDLQTEQDRINFYAFKEKMVPALRDIANSKPENTFFRYKKFSDTK
jgi:hypothetical protein